MLRKAAEGSDIGGIEIEGSRVRLREGVSLDVGAIAKGFATQKAIDALRKAGCKKALINAGGNVAVLGVPLEKEFWRIGISALEENSDPLDTVDIKGDRSVVTSGGYNRYYTVEGISYHHIIDPETLYPANRYGCVTIIQDDSGISDMLSTACFILDFETGKALLEKYNAQGLWVNNDGSVLMTEGYKAYSVDY
jgi:thiamine biosynthesis lipoprotein